MIIRPATLDDIPTLVDMGHHFYTQGAFGDKGLNFSPHGMARFFEFTITAPMCVFLVAETNEGIAGAIAGIIGPWACDGRQPMLQEFFWYAPCGWVGTEGGLGRKLQDEYERIGKESGAVFCLMGTQDGPREDVLKRLYERRGYKHFNHQYIKEL